MQSLYFRHWVPPLLKQCRQILTNSNFTASEIVRHTGLPINKITVTPLGYDPNHFYPLTNYQRLYSRPYLLHVGHAYPHKNLRRLIQAFADIAQRYPEVDLLLLGKNHPSETRRLKNLTRELGIVDRVLFKSYARYDDLPNWYRGALAFVYPSLWEGFGLPIIEAMACGCPVITSSGSGTQEVAGDAAFLINPYETSEISAALLETIEQPASMREHIKSSGICYSKIFSWEFTQALTSEVITNLM